METILRISLFAGLVVYFLMIFMLLRKNKLSLKYSLLWIFSGAVMSIFVLFPTLLDIIANLFGIYTPINALFALILFFMIILLVTLTSIVSAQAKKITTLIQEISINDKAIRELEKKISAKK